MRHLVGRNRSAGARRPAPWTSPSTTPSPCGHHLGPRGHALPLSSLAFCLPGEETGSTSLDPGSGSQVLRDPGRFVNHSAPQFLYFAGRWPGLIPSRPALCRHADLTLTVILAEDPCLSGQPERSVALGEQGPPDRTLGWPEAFRRGGFGAEVGIREGLAAGTGRRAWRGHGLLCSWAPGAEWVGAESFKNCNRAGWRTLFCVQKCVYTEKEPKKVSTSAPLCQGGNQTPKRPTTRRS